MSADFTARLQSALGAAALREERRGPLGRRVADLKLVDPRWAAGAAAAVALLVGAVLIAMAGGSEHRRVAPPQVADVFPLADNLGTVGAGFGSVWVADTGRGDVLRIDPESHAILARVRISHGLKVAVGAGAVWALAKGSTLLRIDPATDRVTARTPVRAVNGVELAPTLVQVAGGVPWVVGDRGALRIDPRSGRVARFVRIPQSGGEVLPSWVVVGPGGLWVETREGTLQRHDLASGQLLAELPLRVNGIEGVLPTAAGPVYNTFDGTLALADARTGAIRWQHSLGTGLAGPPLLVGDTLWAHASETRSDRLVAVDLRSGAIRSTTGLPE